MAKLNVIVPTVYDVNIILDKDGKPRINLEDFCRVLDWSFTCALDFFNDLHKAMGSYWPGVNAYVDIDDSLYITVQQAYALIAQADNLNRIHAAKDMLERDLLKALNQGVLD